MNNNNLFFVMCQSPFLYYSMCARKFQNKVALAALLRLKRVGGLFVLNDHLHIGPLN